MEAVVQNGVAQTVLGPVSAEGFADGTPVVVLVRHDGVLLSDDGTGVAARVDRARPLGGQALLFLAIEEGEGSGRVLHARVASGARPAEGSRVRIAIDPGQAFVFPAGPTK